MGEPKVAFRVGDWVVCEGPGGVEVRARVVECREVDGGVVYTLQQFPDVPSWGGSLLSPPDGPPVVVRCGSVSMEGDRCSQVAGHEGSHTAVNAAGAVCVVWG